MREVADLVGLVLDCGDAFHDAVEIFENLKFTLLKIEFEILLFQLVKIPFKILKF